MKFFQEIHLLKLLKMAKGKQLLFLRGNIFYLLYRRLLKKKSKRKKKEKNRIRKKTLLSFISFACVMKHY